MCVSFVRLLALQKIGDVILVGKTRLVGVELLIASLSLGGIILLVVSSIVLLRSPEALARQFFPDDRGGEKRL